MPTTSSRRLAICVSSHKHTAVRHCRCMCRCVSIQLNMACSHRQLLKVVHEAKGSVDPVSPESVMRSLP